MSYDYYRYQAIIGARPLIAQYGIDRCIRTCRRFCDALAKDDDFKEMRLLCLESNINPCLDQIRKEAIVNYGAHNLLSAFYYWANDVLQSDLWFQIHVLAANRIFNQTNELNDGAK